MDDNIPRSLIYAKVDPEHIAEINSLLEGTVCQTGMSIIDEISGIMSFSAKDECYDAMLDILESLPFSICLLDSYDE